MADTYIGATGLTYVATNSTHAGGSSGTDGLSAEVWNTRLWKYVAEKSFWNQFMGDEGTMMPIIFKNDLTRGKGDLIHFNLVTPIDAAPITKTSEAWGSEDTLTFYRESVMVDLIRQAVKIDVPLSEQRIPHPLREVVNNALRTWWADGINGKGPDYMVTRKLTGSDYADAGGTALGESATANSNIMYGGDAYSTASIDSSDILDSELVWKLAEAARLGYIGTSAIRKIFPITGGNGAEHYMLVIHPYQAADLKHSAGSDWEDFQKWVGVRGNDNPLWVGTGNLAGMLPTPIGRLHGVLIYEYAGIPTASTWGESGAVNGCTAIFLGAQAGAFANCKSPEYIEEGGLYKEYYGVMTRAIMGFDKTTFNSIDNGVIAVKTAGNIHYTNAA